MTDQTQSPINMSSTLPILDISAYFEISGRISISGFANGLANGSEVAILVLDIQGNSTSLTATVTNGAFQVLNLDERVFAPGNLTITASAGSVTAQQTLMLLAKPDFSPIVIDEQPLLNALNQLSIRGKAPSLEPGQEVQLVVRDVNGTSVTATAAVQSDGRFSVQGFSTQGLMDGTLFIDVLAQTASGNISVMNASNLQLVSPSPEGADKTLALNEDTPLALSAVDFGYDSSNGFNLTGIKISGLPGAGKLVLNGVDVVVDDFVSVAQLNAGLLEFRPPLNASGNAFANFKFKVMDDRLLNNEDRVANTITFNVIPVNDAPVLGNLIPDQVATFNAPFSYTVPANTFSDVDSPLTYSATLGSGAALPAWLTFNATTRTFSGTPPNAVDFNLRVTASDGTTSVSDVFAVAIAPVVTSLAVVSAAGAINERLNAGDVATIEVNFIEAVTVTGTPQLAINIGGTLVQSNYVSGSGSTKLTFRYTVQAGQNDPNGISIDPNALTLNGGTIKDAQGNNAILNTPAVTDNASFKIDTENLRTVSADGMDKNFSLADDTSDTWAVYSDGTTKGRNLYVTVAGTEALQQAQMRFDGGAWTNMTLSGNKAVFHFNTALTVGDYAFDFRTLDLAGNFSAITTQNMSVSNWNVLPNVTTVTTAAVTVPDVTTGQALLGNGTVQTFTVSKEAIGSYLNNGAVNLFLQGGTTGDAGSGTVADHLRMTGDGAVLNLTNLLKGGYTVDKIQGFEFLDMRAAGKQAIVADAISLGSVSTSGWLSNSNLLAGYYAMVVRGGPEDTLIINKGGDHDFTGFVANGTSTNAGNFIADGITYNIYRNDTTMQYLLVQQGVQVSIWRPTAVGAPVNIVPLSVTAYQDVTKAITDISVEDINGNLSQVRVSVLNGTLSMTLNGTTVSAGALNSSAVTLTGTQEQLNAALATLTYKGNASYFGSDTLTIVSTDSTGTPLSDTDTINITVSNNNAAPLANPVEVVTPFETNQTPEVTITDNQSGSNVANGAITTFTLYFNEPIAQASLTEGDLSVINGTLVANSLTKINSSTWTVQVQAPATGSGSTVLSLANLGYTDLSGAAGAGGAGVQAYGSVVSPTLGTSGADTIIGSDANDTLTANGGADQIFAGLGNDTIIINESNVAALNAGTMIVDGGLGVNFLQLTNASTATTLDMTSAAMLRRVRNISSIDLTGTANNTLRLNYEAVTTLGTTDNSLTTGADESKMLVVSGNASDSLQLVTVTFSEVVSVTGTPQLALNIGGTTVFANYAAGSGSTALTFSYTIGSAQNDTNGISIAANALSLNAGSIKDAGGNNATLSTTAVTDNASYLVDTTTPTVSSLSLSSANGALNNTLNAGDVVTATVNFSEAVTVTNTPQLALNIGGTTVYANYAAGSGTSALTFSYTILATQNDANGISIDANALSLNTTGTLQDAAGNNVALSTALVADNVSFKVDTSAPTVTALAIAGATGVQNNTLNAGDTITFSLTLSEGVTVTGMPRLALNIGGAAGVFATYDGDTSTPTVLKFKYTVMSGVNDSNGLSIDANALSLNGGTLLDGAGNALVLSTTALADNLSYLVDTSAPALPVLTLGTGVAGGATAAEATAAGGVVLVTAEAGASVAVTFTNGAKTVLKTVIGNGNTPVPVVLGAADLTTLTNGTINVSAVATDAAGNASSAGTSSFVLDTAAPTTPTGAITTYVDNVGSITNDASTATSTDDTTPGINLPTGLATSGDTVKLYVDGVFTPATYNNTTGVLTPNSALATSTTAKSFTYTLTDAAGNESGQSSALSITVLAAPVFTSGTTASAAENTATSTAVYTAAAGSGVTYSIATGAGMGADGASFSINSSTGVLTFIASPNFEVPTDAGANNVYDVTVRATNLTGAFTNQNVTVTVTNVNEAPLNTVPAAQTVNEDTALTIAGLSVADVDSNLVTTRLTVNSGVLNVNLSGGASISAGVNGSTTLTLSGTATQINAALATLSYQGNSNFNGTDTLTVFSTDAGGLTDSDAVAITVTSVNDAPVVNTSTIVTMTTISEDAGTPTGVVGMLVSDLLGAITDVDVGAARGLAITGVNGNGTIFFSINGGNTWSAAAGTLSDTNALLLDAANRIYFRPAANWNGTIANAFLYRAWDQTNGAVAGTQVSVSATGGIGGSGPYSNAFSQAGITVTAVNDAPVLATSSTLGYTENAAATAINTAITVVDVDSTTLSTATVSITGGFATGQDVLSFANTDAAAMGNIAGNYNATTGVMTLSSAGGAATLAQWQTALRAVAYNNSSDAPSTAARTVSYTVNDGTVNGNTVTSTINVTAVNDAPVVLTTPTTLTTLEDTAITFVISTQLAGNVSDADGTAFKAIGIWQNTSTNGVWAYSTDGGTSWTNFPSSLVSAPNGTSVMYLNATDSLRFTPTANANGTAIGSLDYRAIDVSFGIFASGALVNTNGSYGGSGGVSQERGSILVNATAVNDAPVLATGSTLGYTENAAATAINTAITVVDVDSTTLSTATVSITGGFATGQDVLSFANTGAAAMGNIAGSYNATTGVMTLSSAGGTATLAQWQAALRAVAYNNSSDAPSTAARTVSYTVNDGTVNGNTVTSTITVTAVNDAPVLADTVLSMPDVMESQRATAPVNGTSVGALVSSLVGGITDVDTGAVKGIAITGVNTGGTLYYSLNGGTTWTAFTDFSNNRALGILSDSDNRVYFVPASTDVGTIPNAFTFRAWDQSGGAPEGAVTVFGTGTTTSFSTATDTVAITVVDNVAPVITQLSSGEAQITTTGTGTGTVDKFASTAAMPDGSYVTVWQSNKSGDYDIYLRVTNADGSVTNSQVRVNDTTAGDQQAAQVVALTGVNAGKFLVMWGATAGDAATPMGKIYTLSNGTLSAGASVAMSGTHFTLWSEFSPGFNYSLNATPDGGFVVTTMSNSTWNAYTHTYNSSLALASAADGVQVAPPGSGSYMQNWPDMAVLKNGTYAYVAMNDGTFNGSRFNVYLSVYNPTTATWVTGANALKVNTSTSTSGSAVAKVAGLQNTAGDLVVVWQSSAVSDGGEIRLQRMSNTGVAIGSEVVINTVTTGIQASPNVTALRDGGYVVMWRSENIDGSGYAVMTQRYDGSGVAVGTQQQLNRTLTANDQVLPSLIELSNGALVYTYQDQNTVSATGDTATISYIVQQVQANGITSATGVQNNTLNAGDVVTATVNFSEAVTVTGTPQLTLNIGGTLVQANYASGSGSSALTFTYTILANQTDANGISLNANALSLNAGTIQDAAGNNATLTMAAVVDNASYRVDAVAPTGGTLALAADTGSSNSDGITNNNRINVGGLEGGTTTWQFSTDSGATWTSGVGTSFTLADGTYAAGVLRVRQTDAAGNVQTTAAQNAAQIRIDTGVPFAPLAVYFSDDHGTSGSDWTTTSDGDRTTFYVVSSRGTRATSEQVEYSTNGGTTWAGVSPTLFGFSGLASVMQTALPTTTTTYTFRIRDAAGNVSSTFTKTLTSSALPTAAGTAGTFNVPTTAVSSTVIGSTGNDTFVLNQAGITNYLSQSTAYIEGHGGNDTLRLTGAGTTLNLLNYMNDYTLNKVQGFELIDMSTDGGAQTLIGNAQAFLSLTNAAWLFNSNLISGYYQLVIRGTSADALVLGLGDGFDTTGFTKTGTSVGASTAGGTFADGITYDIWTNDILRTQLLVQQGIVVSSETNTTNAAPVLSDTALSLALVDQSPAAPSGAVGTLVSSLVGGVSDNFAASLKGIAITAVNTTQGTLYFSTDGGANWSTVTGASDTNALLLAADGDNRVYFAPAAGVSGAVTDAMTIRAWDRTSGADGAYFSTFTNGGTSAFSTATDTVRQPIITPVTINAVSSDGVMASNETLALSGTATPGATVNLGVNGQTLSVVADSSGNWAYDGGTQVRYVMLRKQIGEVNTNNIYSVMELQVWDTSATPVNLALGKTVTSNQFTAAELVNLTDNNTGTTIEKGSLAQGTDVWIQLDLGGLFSLSAIRAYARNANQEQYDRMIGTTIFVSTTDMSGLTMAQQRTSLTVGGSLVDGTGPNYLHTFNSPATSAGMDLPANSTITAQATVLGTTTSASTSATVFSLVSSNPADNGYIVALGDNLTLTFNRATAKGTGTIQLFNAANTLIESFDVASSMLVTGWGGNTLTLNPTSNLTASTGYYIKVASTAVRDTAGNFYAGIATATALNFTTPGTDGSITPQSTSGNISYLNVSSLGDVNGDGHDDYMLAGGSLAYVVYGNASGTAPNLSNGMPAGAGFKITKPNIATAISGIGDINGDGYADILIAPNDQAFVVYGRATGVDINLTTYTIAASDGYKLPAGMANGTGASSGVGDVNGDGFADLLIGNNDTKVSVVFGMATTSATPATTGFIITGQSGKNFSTSLSGAGDVNGDGLADMIIGEYRSNRAYVVYGKPTTTSIGLNDGTIASSLGYVITGGASFGFSVSSAGDVNGDGLVDVVVANNETGNYAAYVVYGNATGSSVNVTSGFVASQGFKITGATSGGSPKVTTAGDMNGDGFADMLVQLGSSAYTDAYVVYGAGTAAALDLSSGTIAANRGFKIAGSFYDLSNAGDVNGDGLADLVFGGTTNGAAYSVLLGGTQWITSAVNLTGTATAEAVLGTAGDDTLTGGGGVDRFMAGKGNDTIVLTASDVTNLANVATGQTAKASVSGGAGYDTLRLSGGAALNLTAISNAGAMGLEENSRIESIERIDLASDTAANTLTLTSKDVNDMAGMNLIRSGTVSADGNTWTSGTYTLATSVAMHQLVVDGTATDSLVLATDSGIWVNAGTVNKGGTSYNVYQNTATNTQVISQAAMTNVVIDLPPTLVNTNPGDNGYMMAVGNNLTLTFNQAIVKGSGFIVLHRSSDNSVVESFDVASSSLVTGWNSTTLTINPTANLTASTGYHLRITPGAIKDTEGSVYAGIADATTLNFTTANASGVITVNSTETTGATWVNLGGNMAALGDFNGDGYGDFIVGADVGGSSLVDSAYVIYGNASGSLPNLSGNSIAASAGFKIVTGAVDDYAGAAVASVGDINGDGLADAVMTVKFDNTNATGNSVFVVYGKSNASTVYGNSLNVNNIASSLGFQIKGNSSWFGTVASNAGDVNGDGLNDLLVTGNGNAFVIYGNSAGTTIDLVGNNIAASQGYKIRSSNVIDFGDSASGVGDFNGDGLADFIVGASNPTTGQAGMAYVVYGNSTGTPVTLDASNNIAVSQGFKITGLVRSGSISYFASAVSGAGDVNGDGLADVMVSSPLEGAGGTVYVLYGNSSVTSLDINVASGVIDPSRGFKITSSFGDDLLGRVFDGLSSAGDVNGDGLADMIISGRDSPTTSLRSTYIVYGNASGTSVAIDASGNIASSLGFRINGSVGLAVANGGDINGDGLTDLLVSSTEASSRTSYNVILGGTQWVTSAVAGAGAVTGTAGSEAIIGSAGNDTLTGSGGVDRFFGGMGNDTVVLSATDITNLSNNTTGQTTKSTVNGGTGFDTLRLSGGANLDLLSISNAGAMGVDENSRIEGIERIDMATDTAANVLKISNKDVNDMAGFNQIRTGSVSADGRTWTNVSGTALSATTPYHQMVIDGGNNDTVALTANGGAWASVGTVSNGTLQYTVFQNTFTNSQVLVRQGVTVHTQAPTLLWSTPADNDFVLTANLGNNITLRFSENVVKGQGFIQLWNKTTGQSVEAFDVNSSTLVTGWDTNTLTINPSANLLASTDYFIKISDNAIQDVSGLAYSGMNSDLPLNFSTQSADGSFAVTSSFDSAASTSAFLRSVSTAGDFNGDGYDDLLIGVAGSSQSGVYVVYGNALGESMNLDRDPIMSNGLISQDQGFKIHGANFLGTSVSGIGDVNGDGFADVLIGAPSDSQGGTNAGAAFVVYGSADPQPLNLAGGTIALSRGFKISSGKASSSFGIAVSGVGDFNGDGIGDFIIGADSVGADVVSGGGSAYVIFGKTNANHVVLDANNNIGAADGLRLSGSASETAGTSVSAAGDVNGDGLADVLVGANGSTDTATGSAYVIFGGATGGNLSSLVTASQGFKIQGNVSSLKVGTNVSSAGDVNGDGFADLIVATDSDQTTTVAYVVYGSSAPANVNLTNAAMSASAGFRIVGNSTSNGAVLGQVSSAGDINGDGFADVIVGSNRGSSYVVYGSATGVEVDLAGGTIAASQGFKLTYSTNTTSVTARDVSFAGDFDGDGLTDLVIAEDTGTGSAESYKIVFGGTQWLTTPVIGSGAVTGTAASEAILGSTANDTLTGGGGVDRFMAGLGNDTMVLTANDVTNLGNVAAGQTARASVNGGGGFDTIRMSGGAALNLTAITHAGAMGLEENSRIESIERIDLATDTAANTLTLAARDVKDMAGFNLIRTGSVSADGNTWTNVTGTALSATTRFHQLVVDGGSNDNLILSTDLGFWSVTGTVNNGTHNYTVYQNTGVQTQVLVRSGVVVTNNDSVAPVVFDLNRDGVLSYGQVTMDVNGDGHLDTTAWAGAQDGVLVWDKFADGLVHDNSQYAFAQYATTYRMDAWGQARSATDLEGLADAFDSNGDGVFDAQDAKFAEFKVWQDADQDGVSDAGEVRSLADWGITSINLVSDGVVRNPAAGVTEAGRSLATTTDGQSMLVADAAFAFRTATTDELAWGESALQPLNLSPEPFLNLDALLGQMPQTGGDLMAAGLPTETEVNGVKLDLSNVLSLTPQAGLYSSELLGDANDRLLLSHGDVMSTVDAPVPSDAFYGSVSNASAHWLMEQHIMTL